MLGFFGRVKIVVKTARQGRALRFAKFFCHLIEDYFDLGFHNNSRDSSLGRSYLVGVRTLQVPSP